jgi:cytochrome c-type biogenesis protein
MIDWLFEVLGRMTNVIQPLLQQGELSLPLLSTVMAAGLVAGVTPFGLSTMVFVAGRIAGEGNATRTTALRQATWFSVGAAASLFVAGVAAALAGEVLVDYRLAPYLPVLTLVMGLQLLGLWKWGWLRRLPLRRFPLPSRERSREAPARTARNAFLLGVPFGVVTAPCTAPIIVAVLSLIAANGDMVFGVLVLLAFSVGRSAPLIAGCTYGRAAIRHLAGGRGGAVLARGLGSVIVLGSLYFLTLGRVYLGA